jgi:uroporphyrinogen decarboxylase
MDHATLNLPPTYLSLNSRQRLSLLLIDEIPDRVVVYPLVSAHAAAVAGMGLRQYVTDGNAMAQAQIAALRLYKHDAVSIFSDVAIVAEALGSKLYFSDDDVPVLQQPALDSGQAAGDLRLPDAESLPGRYEVYLDAITSCQREVGDVTPVMVFIPAPFTTAALLRGTEDFLVDTLLDPQACHHLLDLSLQAAVAFTDLCIDAGAVPMLVDPLASASVISPQVFHHFAEPYLRRFSDHLHRSDFDVFLHICGRSEAILDGILATQCDLFSCDEVPLNLCREKIGSQTRLIGNLRPTDLLQDNPSIIRHKVADILAAGKDNPKGFILSTGCEVPIRAPQENVLAFVEAGRNGGRYWANG